MAAEEHIVRLIKTKFHYVSFTLSPGLVHTLAEVLCSVIDEGIRRFDKESECESIVEGIPSVRLTKHRAWVPIMFGCNNFCSYCIVPYTRGRERSRASGDIISDCERYIKEGVKEIFLLGQNVNSYSADMNFAKLLEAISRIDGDFIVRFMTSHPKDVSNELIEVMASNSDKIAPYFHLPLQSGSNRILSLMNRTYTRDRFLEIAKNLRAAIPGIALSTDVIIGFPGETEEDFLDTLAVLREVKFDIVYAFNYSPRKGTPAADMDGAVAPEIKDDRMQRLLLLQDNISLMQNQPYLGKCVRVLVDSVSKRGELGTYTGRTASNKLVHFISDASSIGEFVNIEITEAKAFELIGKIKK
jgi:tRNA-2-methylthio-N6-dimethylallyladenosine synthase